MRRVRTTKIMVVKNSSVTPATPCGAPRVLAEETQTQRHVETRPGDRSLDDSPERRPPWRSARTLSVQGGDGPRSHRRPARSAPSLHPGLCLELLRCPLLRSGRRGMGQGSRSHGPSEGRGAPHRALGGQGSPSQRPSGAGEPLTGALGGRGAPHRCPQGQGSRSHGPSRGRGAAHRCPQGQGSSSQVPSGAGEALTAALGGQGSRSQRPSGQGSCSQVSSGAGEPLTRALRGQGSRSQVPSGGREPLTGALRGQGIPSQRPSGAGEPLTAALGGQGSPSQVPSGAGSRSRCPRSPGPSGIRSKQWSVWKDHAVKTVLSGASRVPWIQPRRSTAAQRKMPQSSAPGTHASEYPGTEREDDPHEMERFSPTLWSNLVFRREESC